MIKCAEYFELSELKKSIQKSIGSSLHTLLEDQNTEFYELDWQIYKRLLTVSDGKYL